MSTLLQMQEQIQRFCQERDWDQFHSAKNLSIGVVTEAAELLDLFRYKSEEEVESLMQEAGFRERMGQELADVFCFILRLSHRYNLDLVECFERKMRLNAEKYPIDKAKGSNKKYTEL